MMTIINRQRGSAIGTVIGLIVIGYGVFVGIQYAPILIEEKSIDSILESLVTTNRTEPVNSTQDVQALINKNLNLNEMDDMREHFNVTRNGNEFTVHVNYERDLNLLFQERKLAYSKKQVLR